MYRTKNLISSSVRKSPLIASTGRTTRLDNAINPGKSYVRNNTTSESGKPRVPVVAVVAGAVAAGAGAYYFVPSVTETVDSMLGKEQKLADLDKSMIRSIPVHKPGQSIKEYHEANQAAESGKAPVMNIFDQASVSQVDLQKVDEEAAELEVAAEVESVAAVDAVVAEDIVAVTEDVAVVVDAVVVELAAPEVTTAEVVVEETPVVPDVVAADIVEEEPVTENVAAVVEAPIEVADTVAVEAPPEPAVLDVVAVETTVVEELVAIETPVADVLVVADVVALETVAANPVVEDAVVIDYDPVEDVCRVEVPITETAVAVTACPVIVAEVAALDAEAKQVKGLESAIEKSVGRLVLMSATAVNMQKAAAESVQNYITTLNSTLKVNEADTAFDQTWMDTSKLEKASQGQIEAANVVATDVQQEIDVLLQLVKDVRSISGANETANQAAEVFTNVSIKLAKATEEIRKANADFSLMQDYHQLVSKAKDQLKIDLTEFAPDLMKMIEGDEHLKQGKVPVSEVMLVFALKKAEFFAGEIENEKLREQERLGVVLEKQRLENEQLVQQKLADEEARLKTEEQLNIQKREAEVRSELEQEITVQLKRQAHAHREHIVDVLSMQEGELNEKHQKALQVVSDKAQVKYETVLDANVHLMQGIQTKLEDFTSLDTEHIQTQQLYTAAQNLYDALETGDAEATKSLMQKILAMAANNEILSELVSNVPEQAMEAGTVANKVELVSRFPDLKRVCKRLALIEADGGSWYEYGMSYLRSFTVWSRVDPSKAYEPVDLDKITPYDILDKAEACVRRGDLETATRFMSRLKGVSRKMAAQWLQDTKLHLETKQSAQVLLAYAASMNGGFK